MSHAITSEEALFEALPWQPSLNALIAVLSLSQGLDDPECFPPRTTTDRDRPAHSNQPSSK